MVDPNAQNQSGSTGQGQSAQQQSVGTQQQQQQAKPIDSFIQKKGIKSLDDVPKLYEDQEASFHRERQKNQNLKQQIEQNSQGQLTVDDNGTIINNPNFQQGFQQTQQNQQQGFQQQEVIYDPITGVPINDPVLLQAARLPFGQRELFFANAALEARERMQQLSYVAETEVLNGPEAKGFENDVRNVMQQLPIHRRANKEEWKDALLRVKGMQFDKMRQQAGQEGVDNFLNKQSIQSMAVQAGAQGGATLTAEQEQTYQWYQENQPGTFKDRQHFLKAYSNKR